jgi:hypothetical protein
MNMKMDKNIDTDTNMEMKTDKDGQEHGHGHLWWKNRTIWELFIYKSWRHITTIQIFITETCQADTESTKARTVLHMSWPTHFGRFGYQKS